MKYNNNIEDFFKDAFTDYMDASTENSWFEIDSKVSRNNFMKFTFSNFNIYYLVTIITTFVVTSYVSIDYLISKNNIPVDKENPLQIEYIHDTITETKVIHKTIEVNKNELSGNKVLPVNENNKEEKKGIYKENKNDKVAKHDPVEQDKKVKITDTVKTITVIKPPPIIKRKTVTKKIPVSNE